MSTRFFEVLLARRLTPEEETDVRSRLEPALAALFFEQSRADQRHGYQAARTVVDLGGDGDSVVTALLHDVGKRHARLGVLGRVAASLLIKLRVPLSGRMALYRDHGPKGADELARLGAPSLAIDFTRHHHSGRPASIDPGTWSVLQAADRPAKTRRLRRVGITSTST